MSVQLNYGEVFESPKISFTWWRSTIMWQFVSIFFGLPITVLIWSLKTGLNLQISPPFIRSISFVT